VPLQRGHQSARGTPARPSPGHCGPARPREGRSLSAGSVERVSGAAALRHSRTLPAAVLVIKSDAAAIKREGLWAMQWRAHPDSATSPKCVLRTPEGGGAVLTDMIGLTLFSNPVTACTTRCRQSCSTTSAIHATRQGATTN